MNQEKNQTIISETSKLESWASSIIIFLIFILPFIFIPNLQQSAVKGYLIIFGIIITAILYNISRLKAKSFEWISHPLSYVGIIFAAILLLSSIYSANFYKSFFGQGFEYSTAVFFIVLLIVSRLFAIFSSHNLSRALSVYLAIFGSFIVLSIFQIIKFIYPTALSFGLFVGNSSTPIGSWYDFGIFSAVLFILSSFAIIYFPVSRLVKYISSIIFVLSSFFLIVTGSYLVWVGLTLVFISVIFQRFIYNSNGKNFLRKIPIFATIIFLVAIFFSWNGNIITNKIDDALKISYTEIHLPWQMTMDVGNGIFKSSPILGSGPNTFAKEYLLYKPVGINPSQFWATEFSSGSGLFITIAMTLGFSGIIIFCLLYVYFIREGIRTIRTTKNNENSIHDRLLPFISYSSFFAGAFLLFMDVVYIPSYTNFFLTFVFIGLFIGTRIYSGSTKLVNIPFNWKGKSEYFGHSIAIIILLVLLTAFCWYGIKTIAYGYFTAGATVVSVSVPSTSDLSKAQAFFEKASNLDHLDIYYQTLSQVNLLQANSLVQQISSAGQNAKATPDQIQQIGTIINNASSNSKKAIKYDSSNYYNYISSAVVYSAETKLQVNGAYDAAVSDYSNALKYNPFNPAIYLSLAQLAGSQGKYDDATSYIGSALQLKNNYTDAVYILSQIQVAQGKTLDAITSVKFATQLTPNDPTAFFQLGLLQYNAGQYGNATTSLARAVALSPNYANAQYFLGLSYSKIGDNNDAITQFEELAKTNPDNADVASILANLKMGKSPFVNQKPPISTPEKRSSLPVVDQSTNSQTLKTR